MGMREKLIELLKDTRANAAWHHWGYEETADYLIANGVTIQKWIPVSERLPGLYENVLVCDVREQYVGAWMYYGNGDWLHDDALWDTEDITHWMPLPEPPREDQQ